MKRSSDDPIIRHTLHEDELETAIEIIQLLLNATPDSLTVTAADGEPIWLSPSLAEAFLDVASLLACREGATLMIVDDDQEISPMQAGEILRVSQRIIYDLCNEGGLSYRKVGRNRRISMRSIVEYQLKRNIFVAGREQEEETAKHRATCTARTVDESRINYRPGRAHKKKADRQDPTKAAQSN